MKAENFVPDNPFFGRYYSKIRRTIQNMKSDLKDIFTAYYVYAGEYIVGNVPKEFVPHLEENIDRRYVVDYFHVYGGGQGKNFGAGMKIKYID